MTKKKNRATRPAGKEAEGESGRAPRCHGHGGGHFRVRRGPEGGARPGQEQGELLGQEQGELPPHGTARKILELLRRAAAFMGKHGSASDDTSDASIVSGGLEAAVGERSRDQPSCSNEEKHVVNKHPPRKGQAFLYTFDHLNMNRRDSPKVSPEDEAPRWFPPAPVYPVDKDEDPYQNERRYEEFCEARMKLSVDSELCTICFFEQPWINASVSCGEMMFHFHRRHRIPGVKCGENSCNIRFRSCECQQLYTSYCTIVWEAKPELRHGRFCLGRK